MSNLVREFERIIFRELDMFIEAGSIEKFALNFKDSEGPVSKSGVPSENHFAETRRPYQTWGYPPKSQLNHN
jgi:hypothetical protein